MSNLVTHAEQELQRAKLFDPNESDYDGKLGHAALELVRLFALQGHSGMSASITLHLFNQLVEYKALTPLTNSPEEWVEVGAGFWQNKRQSNAFSIDGGKTYYQLGTQRRVLQALPRRIYRRLPLYLKYPLYLADAA